MSFVSRLYLIASALSAICIQKAQAQEPLRFEVASVHIADSKPPRSPMPAREKSLADPEPRSLLASPIDGYSCDGC